MEQPKYFDFAFLTPDRGITELAEELARPLWNTFRMSIEQITACMDSGLFERGDPLEISIMMWAEVHGLVTLFRHGRFGPDETMFREIYGKSVQRTLARSRGALTRPGAEITPAGICRHPGLLQAWIMVPFRS